jgi:predicted RNA-binding Zn ribbon-like protein
LHREQKDFMAAQTPEDTHYHLEEGHLCIDFVNTAYIRFDDNAPNGYEQVDDRLTDLAALGTWGAEVGVITPEDAASVTSATDGRLRQFIELREALRRLIRARLSEEPIPAATLTTINATIPPVLTHTRLAAVGDEFRLEMDPLCAGEEPDHALDHLIWAIGQSAIDLLTDADELEMIRECPGEDCGYLFRDTSRGRRRWCSMKTCGNRAKVQRFRDRQKHDHVEVG